MQFEQLAGGIPTLLPQRSNSPVLTRGQPIIITTQRKLCEFKIFEGEQALDMFFARAVYLYFDTHAKNGVENLFPVINYLSELWKIKNIYGKGSKSRKTLGLINKLPPSLQGLYGHI